MNNQKYIHKIVQGKIGILVIVLITITITICVLSILVDAQIGIFSDLVTESNKEIYLELNTYLKLVVWMSLLLSIGCITMNVMFKVK